MKKTVKAYNKFLILPGICLCLIFSFLSCNIDKEETQAPLLSQASGTVQFSVNSISSESRAVTMADLAGIAKGAVISIETVGGTSVYSTEFIPFYNMNGYLITPPITLMTGDYNLTEFIILDNDDNAIFATPMEGSVMARYVNDPLPIAFMVEKDKVGKVVPEVIALDEKTPIDFGYTTFSFEIVNIFGFNIAVTVYDETAMNFVLTDSALTVEGDGSEIYSENLPAITNYVIVSEDYTEYTLTVEKAGYETWTMTYTLEELNTDDADMEPILVMLMPITGPTEVPPTAPPTPTPGPTAAPTPYIGPGTVFLVPQEPVSAAGAPVVIEVHINTGTQRLAAYDITVTFDSAVITLNPAVGDNGVTAGPDGFLTAVNPLDMNTVRINGMDLGAGIAGDHAHLLNINFTAAAPGTTPVDVSVNSLFDTNYVDLGTPNGVGTSVTVE